MTSRLIADSDGSAAGTDSAAQRAARAGFVRDYLMAVLERLKKSIRPGAPAHEGSTGVGVTDFELLTLLEC